MRSKNWHLYNTAQGRDLDYKEGKRKRRGKRERMRGEGEDRELFRDMMHRINEPVITSEIVTDMETGMAFANKIGYPVRS